MGLIVLPALIPDIVKVYETYFEAFKGDLILDVLFPGGINESFQREHAAHTLSYWHTSEYQYTIKCVDTETREIVGMALWDVYLRERDENEWKNPGVTWLEGKERERAEKILNPLWDKKERLWGGRRYVYCHVVAVKPEYQGRGAGALLTKWGIDMAEMAGLPVYLESSPRAYPMYLKMGFEKLDAIVHRPEATGEDEDVEVPLMVRMPKAANGVGFNDWAAKGYPETYQASQVGQVG